AVEATRLGAFDFVEKPLSLAKLLRTVERALDAGRRHRQAGKLLGSPLAVPIGKSRLMQQLRAELQQMAALPSPMLLVGEPGSGREAFDQQHRGRQGRHLLRSEEHTSELQSRENLVCRLLLEKKKKKKMKGKKSKRQTA